MIKKIQIKNFKSHVDTSLEFSKINILTGLNGMGKSSIIQALLLLRQSQLKGLLKSGLDLNGELCAIGSTEDCIYQFATTDDVSFEIHFNEIICKWSFKTTLKSMQDTFINLDQDNSKCEFLDAVIFNNNFQYISAFRNGPTNEYEKDTSSVNILNQISRKEGRCELVAHFLYHFNENIVNEKLILNKENNSLSAQVEAWMREISPNININVSPNDGGKFKINYSYNRGKRNVKTNEFKSTNIGFGVSYVLPIIVATLQACSSPKNNIIKNADKFIIIENPEAHIHPTGQAKLMELICLASQNGVQFLIETHSDHIINGLLVATKKELITPDDSRIYFFDKDEELHATKTYLLPVLKGGRVKNAPKGFFDQMDIDMTTLIGF